MQTQPAGIYVHVPFCLRKCRYCDFYSATELHQRDAFIAALQREIDLAPDPDLARMGCHPRNKACPPDRDQVALIISAAEARFSFLPEVEITLEANPGTVDKQTLTDFKAAGVNRLNLGIQSFDDRQLAFLGRVHTADEAVHSIKAARAAGFTNLGLDIIYGLPGQTNADLVREVEKTVAFKPEHLSGYMLTYEKGTPLDKDRELGQVVPLPEKKSAELFLQIRKLLAASGYIQYEISNFALAEQYFSRHNRKYWNFAPYIGLGPAAHSLIEPVRCWNHRELSAYLADLEKGQLPIRAKESLTPGQQMIEAIYLGLRQTGGISILDFKRRFAVDFQSFFQEALSDPGLNELLEIDDEYCRLTPEGMLVMDTVVSLFVDAIPF